MSNSLVFTKSLASLVAAGVDRRRDESERDSHRRDRRHPIERPPSSPSRHGVEAEGCCAHDHGSLLPVTRVGKAGRCPVGFRRNRAQRLPPAPCPHAPPVLPPVPHRRHRRLPPPRLHHRRQINVERQHPAAPKPGSKGRFGVDAVGLPPPGTDFFGGRGQV